MTQEDEADTEVRRSVTLPRSVWDQIARIAKRERRSASAQVEVLVMDAAARAEQDAPTVG